MSGNAERDLAVQAVVVQTLGRDLESEERDRIKEDDKLAAKIEALEGRVRAMEGTARWWLGIAAAAASMLTILVQFGLKLLPHAR